MATDKGKLPAGAFRKTFARQVFAENEAKVQMRFRKVAQFFYARALWRVFGNLAAKRRCFCDLPITGRAVVVFSPGYAQTCEYPALEKAINYAANMPKHFSLWLTAIGTDRARIRVIGLRRKNNNGALFMFTISALLVLRPASAPKLPRISRRNGNV